MGRFYSSHQGLFWSKLISFWFSTMDIISTWWETTEETIAPSISEPTHKKALRLSCLSSTAVFYLNLVNRCGISVPIRSSAIPP